MDSDLNKRIGSLIKNRRESLNLSQQDVASYVEVSKSAVSRWESGEVGNMGRAKIQLLAEILKVSPVAIVLGDIKEEIKLSHGKKIPLLGTIAAGLPVLAEENIEDYFNIDSKIKADFALRIKGDSMLGAGIFPNDIVFIKRQECLENGEIGAVLIEDTATLKKFYKEGNTVILQSENDTYKPIILTNGNVKILGKLTAVLNIRE